MLRAVLVSLLSFAGAAPVGAQTRVNLDFLPVPKPYTVTWKDIDRDGSSEAILFSQPYPPQVWGIVVASFKGARPGQTPLFVSGSTCLDRSIPLDFGNHTGHVVPSVEEVNGRLQFQLLLTQILTGDVNDGAIPGSVTMVWHDLTKQKCR